MTVIVAAIVGFLTGRMMWLALRKSWNRQPLMRKNFQGNTLPTAAGITLALTVVIVEAGRAVIGSAGLFGDEAGLTPMRAALLTVVLGFSLLGLMDDLLGSAGSRGFAGHMRALARGELSSGAVKLFGGGAVALVASAFVTHKNVGSLLVSGAIIALTANLANLFDLRPGRTTKISLLTFVLLAIGTGFTSELVPVAIVVGAAAALILDDLRERLMIGDTGANALGAALGLGLATQLGDKGRIIALVALFGLNALSEVVSFTKVIERVGPLRMLDQLGRKRPATIDLRDGADVEEPAFETSAPPRRTPMPTSRATVGGAHEADAASSQPDEPAFPPAPPRERGATRSFDLREEEVPADMFGLDRKGDSDRF